MSKMMEQTNCSMVLCLWIELLYLLGSVNLKRSGLGLSAVFSKPVWNSGRAVIVRKEMTRCCLNATHVNTNEARM